MDQVVEFFGVGWCFRIMVFKELLEVVIEVGYFFGQILVLSGYFCFFENEVQFFVLFMQGKFYLFMCSDVCLFVLYVYYVFVFKCIYYMIVELVFSFIGCDFVGFKVFNFKVFFEELQGGFLVLSFVFFFVQVCDFFVDKSFWAFQAIYFGYCFIVFCDDS